MLPEGPVRWLVLANLAWIAGGIVAYATPIDLPILTVIVLVLATVGVHQLRQEASRDQTDWLDRAMSGVAGGWAIIAVMILLPYVGLEEGSLWESRAFTLLSMALASFAMLAWNASVFQALASERIHLVRNYAIFHGLMILVAIIVGLNDGTTYELTSRGETVLRHDLQWAPALAVVPGLVWSLALAQDK